MSDEQFKELLEFFIELTEEENENETIWNTEDMRLGWYLRKAV